MPVSGIDAVIWGGTGQAKVVARLLPGLGVDVACVCDRDPAVVTPFSGVPIFHDEADFLVWLSDRDPATMCFIAAIGGAGGSSRLAVHAYMDTKHIAPFSLLHPTAWADTTASIGDGAQILAMAAVGVDVVIGKQCIVNTHATVDHDCVLGDGVHVMPGAVVAGEVAIEDEAVIGSNATVLPGRRVEAGAFVGAGAVVTRDVPRGETVVGVPERNIAARPRVRQNDTNPWVQSR